MKNAYLKLLAVSILILAELSFAGGSSAPKVEPFLKITDKNYRKRIITIEDFQAKQIFQNTNDGANIELQMFRQYLNLLLQSGRYSIRFHDDVGPAQVALTSDGQLGIQRDPDATFVQDLLDCEFYDEQYLFKGYVTSFEVTSSNGVTAGLSPSLGLYGIGAGFGFTAKSAKMTVNLEAADGYAERVMASADSDANQSQRSFNFNLSYDQLASIGYDYYSQTPLSDVSKAALTNGINKLTTQLAGIGWQGRVLTTDGASIIMLNAGSDVGFKDGDEIEVMDFTPQEDPKCRSMPITTQYGKPGMPLGRFRIYETDMTYAWAESIDNYSNAPIMPGAKVRIAAPVVAAPAPTAPAAPTVAIAAKH